MRGWIQVIQYLREWLTTNWFKLLIFVTVNIFVFCMWMEFRDGIHNFFNKEQTIVVQPANVPVNINATGQQTAKTPEVYINVQTKEQAQATAKIAEKSAKTDPDFNVTQKQQEYTMQFNGGKPITFKPDFTEAYKLEKGQFVYNSSSKMDINIEVPQPRWAIGIGKSFNGGEAITADYRIAHTPFNIWGYISQNDKAAGIKFVQYESK